MKGKTIIEAVNVSKVYRLGAISSGTLKKDATRWWNVHVLKKPDPFEKIIEAETQGADYLWALKDVSFNVAEGEVLGIIGNNGAGKSTLLKILSRVTRPTSGFIRGYGRIASLLEVGTGFHEELTGRENIYLNGNIMGLTRKQIDKKLDEIIDFSGIELYIDTPVKRYSSGMYVRLAFSVSAHLEPDILIVDEALSVGDAEFQKKCMSKIHEVSSKKGKTILLVSHSMQAVQGFCNRVILMEKGRVIADDSADKVIYKYLHGLQKKQAFEEYHTPQNAPGDEHIRIKKVFLSADTFETGGEIDVRTKLHVRFECWSLASDMELSVGMYLFTAAGECVFNLLSDTVRTSEGLVEGCCSIPGNFLSSGSYTVSLTFFKNHREDIFYYEECLYFDVEEDPGHHAWYGTWAGVVRPQLPFTLTMKNKPSV